MTREIESLNKQLKQSKSESRDLKEGVLPELHRENKRLVEENKNLWVELNTLKGRPFEDGKDLSRNPLVEQAPEIPHTVQSNAVYRGHRRRLVMAIDVGTTFSCVSYRYIRMLKKTSRDHIVYAYALFARSFYSFQSFFLLPLFTILYDNFTSLCASHRFSFT